MGEAGDERRETRDERRETRDERRETRDGFILSFEGQRLSTSFELTRVSLIFQRLLPDS